MLRTVALGALGLLLWLVVQGGAGYTIVRRPGTGLAAALAGWSADAAPTHIHVDLDSTLSPGLRDWLVALGRTGSRVTWDGEGPPSLALDAEPLPDPRGRVALRIAAPPGDPVVISDALGPVDSVQAGRHGVYLVAPGLEGVVRAAMGRGEATAEAGDALPLKPVLLLGQAGWEAKFALAALEELGWQVDARLAVSPAGDARQGAGRLALDTSRYAAVVALDSVAARYAGPLAAFVRNGGGLVVAGAGVAVASLRSLLPADGRGGASMPGMMRADSAPARDALALTELVRLRPGAVALEQRHPRGKPPQVAVAAWRVGQGRVLAVGYRDTWRWRMAGGEDDAVRDHRRWWGALVSAVARATPLPRPANPSLEPAPRASLVAALGLPSTPPASIASRLDPPRLLPWAFLVLLAALTLEWASRRLRGAP